MLLYSGFLDMHDLLCSLCDLGLLDKLNSRIGLPHFLSSAIVQPVYRFLSANDVQPTHSGNESHRTENNTMVSSIHYIPYT